MLKLKAQRKVVSLKDQKVQFHYVSVYVSTLVLGAVV